jgi:GNAT superfamily N-acetyltransferase
MSQFHIRKAGIDDFEAIYGLQKEFALFQKTPEKLLITLEEMKDDKDFFHCLVAEGEDTSIVAFVTYFPAYYSWSGKAIYVDDLYVRDNYRKGGIGIQLLQSVIEIARESGCKKVRWQVSDWNQNAIDFYQRLGAEVNDTERNCDLIF